MKLIAFQPYAQREGHFACYTTRVCQVLALLGHRITLVTTEMDPRPYLAELPHFQIVNTGPSRLLAFRKRGAVLEGLVRGVSMIWDNIRVLFHLLRMVRRERFDAIQFFDYDPVTTYALLWTVSKLFRVRLPPIFFVVIAANYTADDYTNALYNLYGRFYHRMNRILLPGYARAIMADGNWQPGELEALLDLEVGFPPLYSIPHGIMLAEKPFSKEEARRTLGLGYDGVLLLYFGILRKDKGVELLIEAMGGVKGECKLLLAGMPFDLTEESVRALIRTHGCENKIIADLQYVPQDRIAYYYSAADAIVYPYKSHYKGTVGTLNTVLAFGKPVIGTMHRSMTPYFGASMIGILVKPDDVESLREGMERFLSLSMSEKEAMVQNGRRLVEPESWTALATRFSDVYHRHLESEDTP